MNKILIIVALSVSLAQCSLQAALPPLFQSRAEFKALIEDKHLTEKLKSGEAIVSITRSEKSFTVVTTRAEMQVDVVYDKSDKKGPLKFHLVFHDPQSL